MAGWLDGEPRELAERRVLSEEPVDVLTVGIDRRPDAGSEGMGVRADTLILTRVFPGTGEIRLLSVPRDLFVEISPGTEDRVNAAYSHGGVEQTVRAVESYTGVDIDHYAVADFEGFEEMVDAMGGVEVDVVEGEYPPELGLEEGRQKLSGHQALAYARYRGTSGGDLDRIERQQEVLVALKRQALEPDSVSRLPEVARAAKENIETDLGLSESFALGKALLERGREAPVEAGKLVGEPTILSDGRQVLLPDDEANRRLIEEFLR